MRVNAGLGNIKIAHTDRQTHVFLLKDKHKGKSSGKVPSSFQIYFRIYFVHIV